MKNPKTLKILGIGLIIMLIPEYRDFTRSFHEDYLKLQKFHLAILEATYQLFQAVAIILFRSKLRRFDLKKLICFFTVANFVFTSVYAFLLKEFFQPGKNYNFPFLMILNGIKIILKDLPTLPILAYWTS